MDAKEIEGKLHDLSSSMNLDGLDDLCDEIDGRGDGGRFLDAIFAILENNPSKDFGSPGAIVHAAERYFGKGYEQKLIESLSRNPTVHTVWMLNRVINGVDGDLKVFWLI
ncbi:hypothetical protein [Burkholderia gladioli]|uniref:hypothetical protein n=1 Tax=Burkholderia gladioli TaxID=28095 RepID=UPI000CFFA7A3|nr:hypothetical protein [Burkholderia gladioli]PRH05215.1 hypothetical protein C6V08_10505 [Burkholderia gladioli]